MALFYKNNRDFINQEFDDRPSWRRFHLVDFPTVTLRRLIAKDRKLFRLN